jgi:hypothetical protein
MLVEDIIYSAGFREEYSIAAYYAPGPAQKDRGYAVCDALALDRAVPGGTRNLARSNLSFYTGPASALMPSFMARAVGSTSPDGYHPLNPSIARWGNNLVMVLPAAKAVTEDDKFQAGNKAAVHTRNFLLRLDHDLEVRSCTEILPPSDLPNPPYSVVRGFQNMKPFSWRESLWCCAFTQELIRIS